MVAFNSFRRRLALAGALLLVAIAISTLVFWQMHRAAAGPAPVRLVIISPHRDEIREEVAHAFAAWLAAKNADNTAPVEVIWQDIGGGSSQIARYVKARFDANPDGIDIDLLFGGGTDIY